MKYCVLTAVMLSMNIVPQLTDHEAAQHPLIFQIKLFHLTFQSVLAVINSSYKLRCTINFSSRKQDYIKRSDRSVLAGILSHILFSSSSTSIRMNSVCF